MDTLEGKQNMERRASRAELAEALRFARNCNEPPEGAVELGRIHDKTLGWITVYQKEEAGERRYLYLRDDIRDFDRYMKLAQKRHKKNRAMGARNFG